MASQRQNLQQARRVVVKLGTAVVLQANGRLNGGVLMGLAQQIVALREQGREVLIVSSGAVGMGRKVLRERGDSLPEKQALAAIGQVELMKTWGHIFGLLDVPVAQILLTREDLRERSRYLNARNTVGTLLESKVLPIFNENDSLATAEIRFGDNDILACLVGALADADAVVNLTQAEGLLRITPESQTLVPEVSEVTDEIRALVQNVTSTGGTGGMTSKLDAARVAADCGIPMVIARAAEPDVLLRLLGGESLGTHFLATKTRVNSRKRWLLAGAGCKGKLSLDGGASRAVVERGSSLLPVGIREVQGTFSAGDLVAVLDQNNREIGRGLVNYDSQELSSLRGRSSAQFESILGYRGTEEAIHRDHLFIQKRSS